MSGLFERLIDAATGATPSATPRPRLRFAPDAPDDPPGGEAPAAAHPRPSVPTAAPQAPHRPWVSEPAAPLESQTPPLLASRSGTAPAASARPTSADRSAALDRAAPVAEAAKANAASPILLPPAPTPSAPVRPGTMREPSSPAVQSEPATGPAARPPPAAPDRAPATNRAAPEAAKTAPVTVDLKIGRIEVRSPPPRDEPRPAAAPRPRAAPRQSLGDYLSRRQRS